MQNKTIRTPGLVAAAAVAVAASVAAASPVVYNFSGSHSQGHAAAAQFTFDASANSVTIRLENTIGAGHNSLDSRAFTGLFWDMNAALARTDIQGISSKHGQVVPSSTLTPEQLWSYRGDIPASGPDKVPGVGGGQQFGLGAAGFGVFSKNDILVQSVTGSTRPNGINGGILSATGDEYKGQNQTPMYREFVEFEFVMMPGFFIANPVSSIAVSNVWFQFGSGFDEPGFGSPPEPSVPIIPLPLTSIAGGLGLLLVAARRNRPGS